MDEFDIIRLDTVGSTNTYISTLPPDTRAGTAVIAREQTGGRGQRGNSWESEPGSNLTMSVLLRPNQVSAREQFMVSEAVALAVARTASRFAGGRQQVKVKWPNDIYAGDMKISGILIENALRGMTIERSIAGIGLNVNQERFYSDAPNPVSIHMLTGEVTPLDEVERELLGNIREMCGYLHPERYDELHAMYCAQLWRADGFYPYTDAATGARFEARIKSIAPTGHITLEEADGTERTYAFKEVQAVM